jgi:hypothetical protein
MISGFFRSRGRPATTSEPAPTHQWTGRRRRAGANRWIFPEQSLSGQLLFTPLRLVENRTGRSLPLDITRTITFWSVPFCAAAPCREPNRSKPNAEYFLPLCFVENPAVRSFTLICTWLVGAYLWILSEQSFSVQFLFVLLYPAENQRPVT